MHLHLKALRFDFFSAKIPKIFPSFDNNEPMFDNVRSHLQRPHYHVEFLMDSAQI